jgi:hypothetical protein
MRGASFSRGGLDFGAHRPAADPRLVANGEFDTIGRRCAVNGGGNRTDRLKRSATPGVCAITSELHLRDLWRGYPRGYQMNNLGCAKSHIASHLALQSP